jgi:hypothetical protein
MTDRLLLSRKEGADALGVSLSHFQRHIQPHLPCVYSGQLRLYRPADLERWAEQAARAPSEKRTRRSHHASRPQSGSLAVPMR